MKLYLIILTAVPVTTAIPGSPPGAATFISILASAPALTVCCSIALNALSRLSPPRAPSITLSNTYSSYLIPFALKIR